MSSGYNSNLGVCLAIETPRSWNSVHSIHSTRNYTGIPALGPLCGATENTCQKEGKQVGKNPFPAYHTGPGQVEDVEVFLWSELLPEAGNVTCEQLLVSSNSHGPLDLFPVPPVAIAL